MSSPVSSARDISGPRPNSLEGGGGGAPTAATIVSIPLIIRSSSNIDRV